MLKRRLNLMLCGALVLTAPAQGQSSDEEAPMPAFPETEIFLFKYYEDYNSILKMFMLKNKNALSIIVKLTY